MGGPDEMSDEREFVLALSEGALETGPGFDRDRYPTMAETNRLSNVNNHHGHSPSMAAAGDTLR